MKTINGLLFANVANQYFSRLNLMLSRCLREALVDIAIGVMRQSTIEKLVSTKDMMEDGVLLVADVM